MKSPAAAGCASRSRNPSPQATCLSDFLWLARKHRIAERDEGQKQATESVEVDTTIIRSPLVLLRISPANHEAVSPSTASRGQGERAGVG